jgi:hypothetical protein
MPVLTVAFRGRPCRATAVAITRAGQSTTTDRQAPMRLHPRNREGLKYRERAAHKASFKAGLRWGRGGRMRLSLLLVAEASGDPTCAILLPSRSCRVEVERNRERVSRYNAKARELFDTRSQQVDWARTASGHSACTAIEGATYKKTRPGISRPGLRSLTRRRPSRSCPSFSASSVLQARSQTTVRRPSSSPSPRRHGPACRTAIPRRAAA